MQLAHKTIVVTGATGGIGSQVCALLAAQGATLILNCVNAARLATLAQQLGGGHHVVVADVSTAEGRDAIGAACVAVGGIDAVINLAGILDFNLFMCRARRSSPACCR